DCNDDAQGQRLDHGHHRIADTSIMKGMSMANTVKGEVEFECGGEIYTFKLGTNAQVLLESRIHMSLAKWIKDKGDELSATDIRLLMWAGLHRHHKLNEDAVGDLIDEIGGAKAAEIFMQAFALAMAPKSNGADRNPPQTAEERIGMIS